MCYLTHVAAPSVITPERILLFAVTRSAASSPVFSLTSEVPVGHARVPRGCEGDDRGALARIESRRDVRRDGTRYNSRKIPNPKNRTRVILLNRKLAFPWRCAAREWRLPRAASVSGQLNAAARTKDSRRREAARIVPFASASRHALGVEKKLKRLTDLGNARKKPRGEKLAVIE